MKAQAGPRTLGARASLERPARSPAGVPSMPGVAIAAGLDLEGIGERIHDAEPRELIEPGQHDVEYGAYGLINQVAAE